MKYTEIVKKAKTIKLASVTKEKATCTVDYEGTLYQFPVPLDDIGDGSLLCIDKPILYARWIRQAIDDETFKPVLNGD